MYSKTMKRKSDDGGRYQAILPGIVSLAGIGNYGADDNTLPMKLLIELQSLSTGISVTKFSKPLQLDAAIELPENVNFSASSSVRLK